MIRTFAFYMQMGSLPCLPVREPRRNWKRSRNIGGPNRARIVFLLMAYSTYRTNARNNCRSTTPAEDTQQRAAPQTISIPRRVIMAKVLVNTKADSKRFRLIPRLWKIGMQIYEIVRFAHISLSNADLCCIRIHQGVIYPSDILRHT